MGQNYFFSLPFSGIKNGKHLYEFDVKSDFLHFMDSPLLKEGEFNIKLELDRRSGICDLKIVIQGQIPAVCDRCVADIKLPIMASYDLVIKVTPKDMEDTEEVIYFKDTENTLILDQVIYELICVSLPLVNIYDCGDEHPRPCNDTVLNKLKTQEEQNSDSVWNDVKIDKNNK